MNKKTKSPELSSPQKVYKEAEEYSTSLPRYNAMPLSKKRKQHVSYLAEDKKQQIKYAIEQTKYQSDLYKRLEEADISQRKAFSTSIRQKDKKIEENHIKLVNKQNKEVEKFNKHLDQVVRKHNDIQKLKKENDDEQAIKLRKQIQGFYKKQQERKKNDEKHQIHVSTCYNNALDRINNIHKKNVQYSLKAQKEVALSLAKNNNKSSNIEEKMRSTSLTNKKKNFVIDRFNDINNESFHKFIQTNGKNEDNSIKAFEIKEKDDEKTKKRIHEFFKERTDKWKEEKKRINERNSQVPEKCLQILDKTTKASFTKTFSTFKDSFTQWGNRVLHNKSFIKNQDEMKKDEIMNNHLDVRLRNTTSFRVSQRMSSMRSRVKKVARDY